MAAEKLGITECVSMALGGMISNDLLPDRVGDSSTAGLPRRTVVLIGGITTAFATYGSLNTITSFASLAFIVVFGGMCVLAVRERHRSRGTVLDFSGS